jgi:hypothetical protein
MKSIRDLGPMIEALEPRQLLSSSAVESAALASGGADWMAGTGAAVHAPRFSHDAGWADSWQSAGGSGGGSSPATSPVQAPSSAAATLTPGTRIAAQIVNSGGVCQLVILGTNASDAITLSQTATSVTVTTAQGSTTYTGAFGGILIYGFGGADTIRLTYSMTAAATIYCGDGGNTVYDDGRGYDTVYGGAGSDTLISFGAGSKHRAYGGGGLDSFWVDGNTDTNDASAAESAAGNVHRIYQFYGKVSMDMNGQNLADPTLTGYASKYVNFAAHPLFTDGPTYSDIRQGASGDCYYLASLAALADTNPAAISQMITSLGDGTYAVRFYRNGSPVYVRIDADLPVSGGTSLAYARFSVSGEMWVPMVEKAYAFFRTGGNSYASLDSGWMGAVYKDVTNRNSQTLYTGGTDQAMYNFIAGDLAAGQAVTLGSKSSASGPIIGGHAYEVKAAFTVGGTLYVTVYNPWGYDGAGSDSNTNDGLVTLTVAQLQQYFTAAVAIV